MTKTIDAQTLHTWLKYGEALLIDVREPDEFASEHIPYALSLPLSQIEAAMPDLSLDKRKIVFQCQLGKRGEKACFIASSSSLKNHEIYNLTGGISEWKSASLLIVSKGDVPKGLPIMRQVQITVGALIATCSLLGFAGVSFGFILAGIFGALLMFAGITGWCGMAMFLSKMPWNKS